MSDPLTVIHGDALSTLREWRDESVQCVVTSPPYFGLRSYGTKPVVWGGNRECAHEWIETKQYQDSAIRSGGEGVGFHNAEVTKSQRWRTHGFCGRCQAWRGELGLEPTPELFVQHLVEIFREVRRILKSDGTCWVNLGDSYASGKGSCFNPGGGATSLDGHAKLKDEAAYKLDRGNKSDLEKIGLKPKDLYGIPWRFAFAMQADGWWLRSDIIWAKGNCMPESVTDRPTRSHEYIFLLTKSAKYYYDHEAIKEPASWDGDGNGTPARKARQRTDSKSMPTAGRNGLRPLKETETPRNDGGRWNENGGRGFVPKPDKQRGHSRRHAGFNDRWDAMKREGQCTGVRNKRDVWNVAPAKFPEAHFATYPPKLIEPCVLAGSRPGDLILDPFGGSGTTGKVAIELGRKAVLIEPKEEYVEMIKKRCQTTIGLPLAI